MTMTRVFAGVTAASITIFILAQDASAAVPTPVSTQCQPDGQYQKCRTLFDDGIWGEWYWKEQKGECQYIYWGDPRQGTDDFTKVCRVGDAPDSAPYRARTRD